MSPEHGPDAQVLHDLRNAANTVLLSVAVARRLLETGETERALGFLAEAESSCKRFRDLLGSGAAGDDESNDRIG
ncbi:MAG: hypothetical protein ACJ8GV_11480 [Luteimonas sp.]